MRVLVKHASRTAQNVNISTTGKNLIQRSSVIYKSTGGVKFGLSWISSFIDSFNIRRNTMALIENYKNNSAVSEKNRAVAFVNWSIKQADGSVIKSSKGFPIYQNPRYPNKYENLLVELAKKRGGSVTVPMECRILLNQGQDLDDIDLDNIVITDEDNPFA
jgi:hypothetical protein